MTDTNNAWDFAYQTQPSGCEDHESTGDLGWSNVNANTGLIARFTDASNHVLAYVSTTKFWLVDLVGGSWDQYDSGGTISSGHTAGCVCIGTDARAAYNGSYVASLANIANTGMKVGLAAKQQNGTSDAAWVDNWERDGRTEF